MYVETSSSTDFKVPIAKSPARANNLDGNQFSNFFFIRYYLYRNLKVEGSLKWKWSLVSFTIKCYNSTKNCMLKLNNQIVG